MTNEEIEKMARDISLDPICRDDFLPSDLDEARRDIALEIRGAVAQAYEEAAQINEAHASLNQGNSEERLLNRIASEIRALKDSLAQEPVAS
jgi:hypothetical protein